MQLNWFQSVLISGTVKNRPSSPHLAPNFYIAFELSSATTVQDKLHSFPHFASEMHKSCSVPSKIHAMSLKKKFLPHKIKGNQKIQAPAPCMTQLSHFASPHHLLQLFVLATSTQMLNVIFLQMSIPQSASQRL